MKDSITILGGALIIALALFIGLTWDTQDTTAQDDRDAEGRKISAMREKAVNMLDVHVSDIKQVLRAINEKLGSSDKADVASHAAKIEDLTQKMRIETAELKHEDTRVLKLLLDRFQHLAHELEHSVETNKHEDAHHAYENMVVEFENLVSEITIMRSRLY